jgi:hypothetical protein
MNRALFFIGIFCFLCCPAFASEGWEITLKDSEVISVKPFVINETKEKPTKGYIRVIKDGRIVETIQNDCECSEKDQVVCICGNTTLYFDGVTLLNKEQ